MSGECVIGLDAGSVSVKIAVLDASGAVVRHDYRRHRGRPGRTALAMLAETLEAFPGALLACTGTAGRAVARRLGAPHVNELVALSAAVARLYPDVTTVFEMGGEDSKLLVLGGGMIRDFALNSVCAAGTGSFLDQQAERLGLTIEQFAAEALKSAKPPRIAGRCSVFAKSDMIHLQQIATPVQDIVAGLCFAVVRNVQGTLVRNRALSGRAVFLGGVALNRGVVRAFRELLGLDELRVPDPPTAASAAGAAFKAREAGNGVALTAELLERAARAARDEGGAAGKAPLLAPGDDFAARHDLADPPPDEATAAAFAGCAESGGGGPAADPVASPPEPIDAYLGIDVGSISTNLAVLDEHGTLLSKRYLRTAGRPIEAVRRGLAEVGAEVGGRVRIRGVGTTGSGRYMIADFVGADVVKNEITAQATAASAIDPDVDTVLEIGGQDSKFINLDHGVIVDFEMNKACAAGTGSFLEEQAEKLAVEIKGEFARRALAAPAPCRLGERCTVFMENSLMDALQRGASTDDLLAGLAYSIVENYVNRVVAGRPIGERVFFQGGTAFNKAVVAAFEKYLGRPVVVPPHHDVTGAIGMARIAREQARAGAARSGARSGAAAASSFKGFDLANRAYEQTSFECKGCENRCEINTVRIEGEKTALHFGGRCEKWDQRARPDAAIEDLFAFRAAALNRAHEAARARLGGRRPVRGVLGIPRIFFFHDFLPLYATIFWELGFRVEVSPETNAEISSLGVRATLADTCYPVKAALGHVRWLAERGADAVFLPSFVNMAAPGGAWSMGHACPLTQSFPYQARTAFPDLEIIAPVVRRSRGRKGLVRELRHALSAYGVGDFELARAVRAGERAQRAYEAELRAKGCEVETLLASGGDGRRTLLVVGRPYNAFDPGMNLDIPRKLARLGVRAVPMDLLPLEPGEGGDRGGGRNGDEAIGNNGRGVASDLARDWPEMYWRSGQRILAAARAAHRHPALGVLFVGNFSCGPDSFILQYFRAEMAGRPFLHVEIDEHSADAGAITRCEAFLDSLDMLDARAARAAESASPAGGGASAGAQGAPVAAGDAPPMGHAPARTAYAGNGAARTVYLPRMCDHSFALRAAFESCGVKAVVMDETDDAAMALARRYVTGKECYPFAVTVADMLRQAAKPDFDPGNAAFFMPGGTGPCRFGQYNVLQRMILERAGLGDVPLYSPSQDVQFYRELGLIGSDYARRSWEGLTAVDLLLKCLHETRPYEAEPGAADRIYAAHLARLDAELPRARGAAAGVLASARAAFAALARNGGNGSGAGPAARPRPLVGIVGEIFVRSNRFSNENLVRRVEELGGEAWLSPVDEWVYYVNWHARDNAKRRGQWRNWLALTVRDRVQRSMGHAQEKIFHGLLHTAQEATTAEILDHAAPHLDPSFRGEAILSVGKGLDMIERGACGIACAMPFGCMPGTVATSILRPLCEAHGVPFIAIPFDGAPSATSRLQLETFMEQAKQVLERRTRERGR